MNIVVYTLTRDRLEYTQRSFLSLRQEAGWNYKHLVIDNGSEDGSVDWLRRELDGGRVTQAVFLPQNIGISAASNLALQIIDGLVPTPDVIVKMDNDCLLKSPRVLRRIGQCIMESQSRPLGPRFLLSPTVTGINKQPRVARQTMLGELRINLTAIVGGVFHAAAAQHYLQYRYPENLPIASGQDDAFCHWWKQHGGEVGYVEGVTVEHMDGTDAQAVKYPAYFQRKWIEERQIRPPNPPPVPKS